MTLIILVVVIALLAIWTISIQNRLVKMDEICMNALRQINVQQQSRFDAVRMLISLMREYSEYEADTLEKIVKARSNMGAATPDVAELNARQQNFDTITSKIFALAEQYPDLKANQQYSKTMDEVSRYEENVRLSRMTFNDTVTKFNSQVRQFPANLIASMLHFTPKEYLAENRDKTEYPAI